MDFTEISECLTEVIRPDIYKLIENLHQTSNFYNNSQKGFMMRDEVIKLMDNIMKNRAPKHKELPLDTMLLLRLIHSIYKDTDNRTYEERIEIYKYNMNPQKEILIEIKNATVFLEKTVNKNYDINKRRNILDLINLLSFDKDCKYEDVWVMNISEGEFDDIKSTFNNFVPNMDSINSELMLLIKNE